MSRTKRFLMATVNAAVLSICIDSYAMAQGRPTSRTETDTTSFTSPYSTNGRTRTWTYAWNSAGQLQSVDGPLSGTGDTVSYTYNADGYLATVTNEVGHVTTISAWNYRGQPTTVVDANGVTTTLTYDTMGRVLTATINPGGSQSQYAFEYDAVGNLTKITLPEGGYLTYAYDGSSRLTQIGNDRGQTQTFTNNLAGAPTAVTVKTSGASVVAQQSSAYDELGRLIQSIGASSQTTGFAYDKVSNPTSKTDARGKVFQAAFDPLDRVVSQTNPESQVVQYAYDGQDGLTSHKDGRTLETTRIVDGFGQVIQEASPDRGTISYWYSPAGRLTKMVDGDGVETDFTYDNAGRRLTATFPSASAENVTYTYDSTASGNKGVDRLTKVEDETGSSTFTYDVQGRLVQDAKVIQGRSYTVGYAYDRNGKITQITLPSGRIIDIARATDGLVTGVTTKVNSSASADTIASSVTYLPFGPLQQLTYGNGLTLTRSFDQNYWQSRAEVKASGVTRLDLTYARNANGELTGVTDNASSGRGSTYAYTDSGRLSTATGPWGADAYTYDAAGNRLQKARTIGGTTAYENAVLASTKNRVEEVQDGSAATLRSLTYNTGGDLSADNQGAPGNFTYQYNARKRPAVIKKGSTDVGWYGYDAFGRRVWREAFGTTTVHTQYVFDADGRLLAEHDGATGAVVKEYLWVDDMPLAVIDSSSGTATTYFIHPGQLNEPLVMTDGSKAKVWDAYVEPFGAAQVFGTASASIDLRLPGQWLQAEASGLHQNWMRDYDPSLGRYVEADPLGVTAGQNNYSYAIESPLNRTDSSGLIVVLIGPSVAGGTGGIGGTAGGGVAFDIRGTSLTICGYKSVGAGYGSGVGGGLDITVSGGTMSDVFGSSWSVSKGFFGNVGFGGGWSGPGTPMSATLSIGLGDSVFVGKVHTSPVAVPDIVNIVAGNK